MSIKLLRNKYTKIILGILWGLGLACIFRYACNGRKCIIFKAPKPSDISNNVYGYDEKCYKYEPITTECNDDAIV
jgi:hypothetical protein